MILKERMDLKAVNCVDSFFYVFCAENSVFLYENVLKSSRIKPMKESHAVLILDKIIESLF
ncbi:hypothetical protein FZC66_12690 [Priestia megaterium]|nr:hypothetical protein FZC66_12690 [Priestia megaterium]